jgi:hypothetical protein
MDMRRTTVAILVMLALATISVPLTSAEPGGRGSQFRLAGGASEAADPENSTNDVVKMDNSGTFAVAIRDLHPGTKVAQLDNQVEVKFYFVSPKTCGVGSPRIQLAIDTDGNGQSNGNAFGYIGPSPQFTDCPQNVWIFQDLTDNALQWDIMQFGGPFYNTWAQIELFFNTVHPNHQVLTGALVEDPATPVPGITYYDAVVIGNRDINVHTDTR